MMNASNDIYDGINVTASKELNISPTTQMAPGRILNRVNFHILHAKKKWTMEATGKLT